MGRRLLACVVIAVLAACGGDEGSAADTTFDAALTRGGELAEAAGCDRAKTAEPSSQNESEFAFTETIDCWLDGRLAVRIHVVAPEDVEHTVNRLRLRYGDELAQCPSGEEFGQYLIAGQDWVAVAASTEVRNELIDRLGGTAGADDGGPPVSYTMMNPCEDVTRVDGTG